MFKVNRKALLTELSLLRTVAERKLTTPILSSILYEFNGQQLQLTATDLDCTLTTRLEAAGEPWAGCVPAKQTHALVRLMEGDELTLTPRANERLEIKHGQSKHLLPTYPATDFPAIDPPCDGSLTLDAELLAAMIHAVKFSALDIDSVVGPADQRFTGLQFSLNNGRLKMQASRKVTFASVECEAEGGEPFCSVIPPQAVNALIALADDGLVSVGATESCATFRNGNRTLSARLFIIYR
jgi:DNA polymerase III subunit beta